MFILVDKNNIVLYKGSTIEFGIYDEPFEKWYIELDDFRMYAIDDGFKRYDVVEFPSDFCSDKYCYTEKDGFYLNPDYVEPYDIETEVKLLTAENEELKTTISSLENSAVESEIETDFRLSMLELGLV